MTYTDSGIVNFFVGVMKDRPAAKDFRGVRYFATDDDGGTMHISDGKDWLQISPGVDVEKKIAALETAFAKLTKSIQGGNQ